MKEEFVKLTDETLEVLLSVADEYLEEISAQLENVKSPEKLIGKKYEEWTPQDLAMLTEVYGREERNPLSNLVFNKIYETVKTLEQEEL